MKYKFYVTFDCDDEFDPKNAALGIVELLSDHGAGDTGLKNITVIPWGDICADFESVIHRYGVEIPGIPKVPKRKRESFDILNTPTIDIKCDIVDDDDL